MTKLLEAHNIKIDSVITKYKHTHMVFLENFNKRLEEKLFMIMDVKEFQTRDNSDKWVKHVLSGAVDELNKEKNPMIGFGPVAAIK